jgi:hypothetical protein
MPVLLGDFLLFFLLGCMGHRNGDCDCEPAQLTGCCPGRVSSGGVGHR